VQAVQVSETPEPVSAKPGRHRHVDAAAPLVLPDGQSVHDVSPAKLYVPAVHAAMHPTSIQQQQMALKIPW
jgi:hypothetical protein